VMSVSCKNPDLSYKVMYACSRLFCLMLCEMCVCLMGYITVIMWHILS